MGGAKTTHMINMYYLNNSTATNFAVEMGFKKQDLHTNKSRYIVAVCVLKAYK